MSVAYIVSLNISISSHHQLVNQSANTTVFQLIYLTCLYLLIHLCCLFPCISLSICLSVSYLLACMFIYVSILSISCLSSCTGNSNSKVITVSICLLTFVHVSLSKSIYLLYFTGALDNIIVAEVEISCDCNVFSSPLSTSSHVPVTSSPFHL